MVKIPLDSFKRLMLFNIRENKKCIEVEFSVDNMEEYHSAWLGKMLNNETESSVYWFGLTENGSQAYDFDSLEKFLSAKVFNGKSIEDIWDLISIISIDACSVEDRIQFYLGGKK